MFKVRYFYGTFSTLKHFSGFVFDAMKGDLTPLMEATSAGHTNIVHLLITHVANVNTQSSSNNTLFMYMCAGGHKEVVLSFYVSERF